VQVIGCVAHRFVEALCLCNVRMYCEQNAGVCRCKAAIDFGSATGNWRLSALQGVGEHYGRDIACRVFA